MSKANAILKLWAKTAQARCAVCHSLVAVTAIVLCLACSETRNLAEGETLYVGIKQVSFDKPVRPATESDTTGVITALEGAYNTVSGLLSGDASAGEALQNKQNSQLTKEQQRQQKKISKKDEQAYANAKSEVEGVLAYTPNNSLMGSSYYRQPLAIGLWTYNKYLYSEKRFGRWMFNAFAANPIYITTVNPRVRSQVAQNTLRNFGYFRGRVSHDTIPQRHPRKAKISYDVHPGELFHLDSVAYLNFPPVADSLLRWWMWQSRVKKGEPFSVPNLDAERTRLSTLFRENGFYYFRPEHIHYRADTVARPLHVQLQVMPSDQMTEQVQRQYKMGRTQINVYEYGARELTDTLKPLEKLSRRMRRMIARARKRHPELFAQRNMRREPSVVMAYSGTPGRPPLKMRAIRRFIAYKPGDLYSLSTQEMVQKNLSGMGIFSQLNMRYMPRDTTATCDTLDVEITARLDKPYDSVFKGNVATKSNGLVGPGLSFSMSKLNVFRGAETLSFEAHGSYEWMTGAQMKGKSNLLNSFEYGTSLNLTYPRLLLMGLGYRFNRRAKATTTYKLSADWMNR